MITHKINLSALIVAAAVLFGVAFFSISTSFAQSTSCSLITSDFTFTNGIYYSSKEGVFIDPATCVKTSSDPRTTVTAQGTLSIPSGYSAYSPFSGIYYNSASGLYFNSATGQYSNTAPLGATLGSNGMVTIPAGYTLSNYGTYFNANTGLFYDPMTGFYSSNAPQGQVSGTPTVITASTPSPSPSPSPSPTQTAAITGTTFTPGVPNTGAGGNATLYTVLAVLGIAAVAGSVYLRKTA